MRSKALQALATEGINPASRNLDSKSALEIARIINREDAKVALAVRRALPQIAHAIDDVANALAKGGRLIYVGTGTSGRIGALDASESAPTFGVPARQVQYIMAGGPKALGKAIEASEDSVQLGRAEIARRRPTRDDVVIGIAASGRTPFTLSAVRYARAHGARTVAVTCNRNSPLERAANYAIVTEVGPEVLSGSSRMKAGTAEKLVLNMISTGSMARLGYVYDNLMVHVRLKNSKLIERGTTIVVTSTGLDRNAARKLLRTAGNDVAIAIIMKKANVSRTEATRALKEANGNVRKAIAWAQTRA